MAATTGMRRGEVLGCRWADLDIETRVYSHAIPSIQEDLADTLAATVLTGR